MLDNAGEATEGICKQQVVQIPGQDPQFRLRFGPGTRQEGDLPQGSTVAAGPTHPSLTLIQRKGQTIVPPAHQSGWLRSPQVELVQRLPGH